MNEKEEHEHPQDDFEVEIISLDQPGIIGDRNNIPFVPLPPKIRSTRRQPNWSLRLAIVAAHRRRRTAQIRERTSSYFLARRSLPAAVLPAINTFRKR